MGRDSAPLRPGLAGSSVNAEATLPDCFIARGGGKRARRLCGRVETERAWGGGQSRSKESGRRAGEGHTKGKGVQGDRGERSWLRKRARLHALLSFFGSREFDDGVTVDPSADQIVLEVLGTPPLPSLPS